MEILDIPFHRFLNIKNHHGDEYIFEAEERPEYLNHLGTVHACVQLSLAEASSGEYLLQQFNELESELIPVVRKTEAKYHRPANGTLYSKASFESTNKSDILNELVRRKKVLLKVKVEIFDHQKSKVLTATFDWFIIKN
jgi:hypothetical protein